MASGVVTTNAFNKFMHALLVIAVIVVLLKLP